MCREKGVGFGEEFSSQSEAVLHGAARPPLCSWFMAQVSLFEAPGFSNLNFGDLREGNAGFGGKLPTFARGAGPEDSSGTGFVALLAAVEGDLRVWAVVGAPRDLVVGVSDGRTAARDGRNGSENGAEGATSVTSGGRPPGVGLAGDDLGRRPPVVPG